MDESEIRAAAMEEAASVLMRDARLITEFAKDKDTVIPLAAMLVQGLAHQPPLSDACRNCGIGDKACDETLDANEGPCCDRCVHPWYDASLSIALAAASS